MKYVIITVGDIAAIIAGTYVEDNEEGNEDDIMTAGDIEAIIAGTYVEENEEETNTTEEIDEIVKNAFEEE